jgi:predicted nucleic acid-binding protein
MTRPINRNGLGLGIADAEREVQVVEAGMSLLADSQQVYREWRKIVVQYNISGVQVHDARLAAAMYVHSVGNILTLNVADFSRFAGLSAIHPGTI